MSVIQLFMPKMNPIHAVVAKIIRTLVFSPAKKMVLSRLFLSFAVVCH